MGNSQCCRNSAEGGLKKLRPLPLRAISSAAPPPHEFCGYWRTWAERRRSDRIVADAEFRGAGRSSSGLYSEVFPSGSGFAAVLEEWLVTNGSDLFRRQTVFHVAVAADDGALGEIRMQRAKPLWRRVRVQRWGAGSFGSSPRHIAAWRAGLRARLDGCGGTGRNPQAAAVRSGRGSGRGGNLRKRGQRDLRETHQSGVPVRLPRTVLGRPAMTVRPLDVAAADAGSTPPARTLTLYRHSTSLDLAARGRSVDAEDHLSAVEAIVSGPPPPAELWRQEVGYFCFGR